MIQAEPPIWPTEDDVIELRRKWRQQGGGSGPYASFGTCKHCDTTAYRFGKTYENMMCLDCFVERNRPKKKRKRSK